MVQMLPYIFWTMEDWVSVSFYESCVVGNGLGDKLGSGSGHSSGWSRLRVVSATVP